MVHAEGENNFQCIVNRGKRGYRSIEENEQISNHNKTQ